MARRSTSPAVAAVVFDLGGVLVEFSGLEDLAELLETPLSIDDIRSRWLHSSAIHRLGVGAISRDEFAIEFAREWSLRVSPEEFVARFETWSRGFLPGARELLAELSSRYRLAALSNSNEIHWQRNQRVLGIDRLFEQALSSHQLGFHKPDTRIFHSALQRLKLRPEQVVFLDDNAENVDAARTIGMAAHLAMGVEGARRALSSAGLL